MTFEWDENKNRINKKKHGVTFEMAVRVFLDDKRIEKYDALNSTIEEERTNVIGRVSDVLILFVVATDRNGNKRIISARKAEPDEEAEYYENYDAR
ncbi:MAG: BrnT family toxin [Bacteroides sp.]|nr:BrnT family toxin [Prevotella sp.]MCM1408508.1 BrnT family toxin [Treponema brennaborense]MCM1469331.1 BrnT family toxin [Bacteroides sp.]